MVYQEFPDLFLGGELRQVAGERPGIFSGITRKRPDGCKKNQDYCNNRYHKKDKAVFIEHGHPNILWQSPDRFFLIFGYFSRRAGYLNSFSDRSGNSVIENGSEICIKEVIRIEGELPIGNIPAFKV